MTENGISTIPVISNVGYPNTDNGNDRIGIIFSHSGRKMICGYVGNHPISSELFDFNTSTGILANPKFMINGGGEFSPDDSKLYCGNGLIWQYNLELQSDSLIVNSFFNLDTTAMVGFKYNDYLGMQLGLDGKIYVINYCNDPPQKGDIYLAVIDSPNVAGAGCHFEPRKILVHNDSSSLTHKDQDLPHFLSSYFYVDVTTNGNQILCEGDTLFLHAESKDSVYYQWTGPNGFTSIEQNPVIPNVTTAMAGIYKVVVTYNHLNGWDTVNVTVNELPQANISGDTTFCEGDSVFIRAIAQNQVSSYLWSNGETKNTTFIKKGGKYSLTLENAAGCKNTYYFNIIENPNPKPKLVLSGDPVICPGGQLTIWTKDKYAWYSWSNGDFRDSTTVKTAGSYYVTVIDSNGCTGVSDTVQVTISDSLKPVIEQSGVLCKGSSITLSTKYDYASYKWNTGDTTKSIIVTQAGKYFVHVKDFSGCEGTSEIIDVTEMPLPQQTITGDSLFCPSMTDILVCQPDYASYKWSNGETTKQITVSQPGNYSVTVTDTNGCTGSANINVSEYDIKLTGLKDLDFGQIPFGSSDTLYLTLKNESNTDFKISKINLQDNSPEFVIHTNPVLPATLAINQTIDLKIIFTPQENKQYSDSLIVEIDTPCQTELSSFLFGETGSGGTFVWLPDTTGKVGEKDYCIPLRAIVTQAFAQTGNLGYSARIKFDATAFLPDSIYSNYILNGNRYVELSDSNVIFTNNSAKLGEFCGQILLAKQDYTPLYIDNFAWTIPGIETTTKDGSLTITGICARNIARIQLFDKTQLEIVYSPNGNEIKAEINIPSTENIKLEIFDGLGNCTNTIYSGKLDKGIYELTLPQQLPSGLQFARLRTENGEILTKGFVVVK